MAPKHHPIVQGSNPLTGPRVRIKGVPGQQGFDAILVDWHDETISGKCATVYGGPKGSESWRTVVASRVTVKRGR